MIHFQDTAERGQHTDLSQTASFRDIKPESGITIESVQNIWETVFDERPDQKSVVEVDEDRAFTEIYGRSEEEFDFDFKISDDLQATLEPFKTDNWDGLSMIERDTAVKDFCAELSKDLGLEKTPKIQYFDDSPGNAGFYDFDSHTVNLNAELFADPKELLNTAAHELRHAYQHQCAEHPQEWTDVLYKMNFDNYISPVQLADGKYLFFTDYQDQFVEVEARAFADLFSGKGSL